MSTRALDPAPLGALRPIPFMGVMKLGFSNGHPDGRNPGQGQPEVGEMEGAPPRFTGFRVEPRELARA